MKKICLALKNTIKMRVLKATNRKLLLVFSFHHSRFLLVIGCFLHLGSMIMGLFQIEFNVGAVIYFASS